MKACRDGSEKCVEAVFVSLTARPSKSEADKVIQWVVHHQAADSFMASRLAVRAADYNEWKSRKHEEEQRWKLFGSKAQYLLGYHKKMNKNYYTTDIRSACLLYLV